MDVLMADGQFAVRQERERAIYMRLYVQEKWEVDHMKEEDGGGRT
jgi:hypothetical protein